MCNKRNKTTKKPAEVVYSEKELKILTLITNFCENECGSCQDCPEEHCVLFNIEKVITGGK